jgi:hypothetical protein
MLARTLSRTDARVEVRAPTAAGSCSRWRWSRSGAVDVATARGQVPAPSADRWARPLASAAAFVDRRRARVAFAVVDQAGVVRGVRLQTRFVSASLVKAMLLVAYLNRADVIARPLAEPERQLLASMIQRSDNDAATPVRDLVATTGFARWLGVPGCCTSHPRHRGAAAGSRPPIKPASSSSSTRSSPSFTVPSPGSCSRPSSSQRWGIPAAMPPRWTVCFKGGWRPANGWVVNQAAFLEGPPGRIAIAILSDHNPSFAYGTRTLRGVAARLLIAPTHSSRPPRAFDETGRCYSRQAQARSPSSRSPSRRSRAYAGLRFRRAAWRACSSSGAVTRRLTSGVTACADGQSDRDVTTPRESQMIEQQRAGDVRRER